MLFVIKHGVRRLIFWRRFWGFSFLFFYTLKFSAARRFDEASIDEG